MNEFVTKLAEEERAMSQERGAFTLFALFLREDAPDRWDLLVAAPWIERDKKDGLEYVAKRLQRSLTAGELVLLSRIVIIEEDNPGLNALRQAFNIEHGRAEIRDSNFFGLPIKHAFVITSSKNGSVAGPSAA
jgi:hypothetical protein